MFAGLYCIFMIIPWCEGLLCPGSKVTNLNQNLILLTRSRTCLISNLPANTTQYTEQHKIKRTENTNQVGCQLVIQCNGTINRNNKVLHEPEPTYALGFILILIVLANRLKYVCKYSQNDVQCVLCRYYGSV